MKPFRFVRASLILLMVLFPLSRIPPAQAIEVYPLEVDFGEVEVGSSSRAVVTIVNYTGHSHTLTVIALSEASSPDFSIATELELPLVLESLESLEVEIVFSPSTTALAAGELLIYCLDNGLKIEVVSLRGGTGSVPPPGACAPK